MSNQASANLIYQLASTEEEISSLYLQRKKFFSAEKGYIDREVNPKFDGNAVHFIAKDGDQIVAGITLVHDGDLPVEEHVDLTKTRKESQKICELQKLFCEGEGETRSLILSKLLESVFHFLYDGDYAFIVLSVSEKMQETITLYNQLGFQQTGEYLHPRRGKTVVLGLNLNKEVIQEFVQQSRGTSTWNSKDPVTKIGMQYFSSRILPFFWFEQPSRYKIEEKRRVVITGIGAVAANGIGKEEFWKSLKEGKNCIDRITCFDASPLPCQIAAEIRNLEIEDYIAKKEIKKMDRSSHIAIVASLLALDDSNLKISTEPQNIGVIVGTGVGGMGFGEKEHTVFLQEGYEKVSPFLAISPFGGALSSEISRKIGARGPSLTLATGCTGSNDGMGYALKTIRNGITDVVLTGGADACITPVIMTAFCRIGAMSTKMNLNPKKACRPFDKQRDGFVAGEGAWIFVFEELGHALKRGAYIYAEVGGYGATCDAHHMTNPLPSGDETARAIELALKDGEILPEQVDYFNAHGTSTPINDAYETMVIKKVFSEHAYRLAVSSTKSMIGHAVGGAGASGVATAILAIDNSFIPPTINYECPDPACDLDYVPNRGRNAQVNVAVCNSIGFGAKNSAFVVKKFLDTST